MDSSNVRYLLGALRRQWWVLAQAMIVVGVVAFWATDRLPESPFETSATLLVKGAANDNDAQLYSNNPDVYFAIQVRVLRSDPVAKLAVAKLSPPMSVAESRSLIGTSYDPESSTMAVSAVGEDPERIVEVANAYVDAYVEYQRQSQSLSLEKRAAQMDADLENTDALINEVTDQMIDEVFNKGNANITALEARQSALIQQSVSLFTAKQDLLTEIASQPELSEPIEPASEAFRPPKPSVPLRTGIGAMVGLILGLALAALREALDDKLRAPEQVARISGAPTLVEVPKASGRIDAKLSVFEEPDRGLSEALRSLRTSIRFLDVDEPVRSVAVTSPAPSDGKSLIAANLAAAFAMAGTKTIVVSGDLRRPSMDTRFGVSGQSGLSDLLFAASERDRAGDSGETVLTAVAAEYYLVETQVPNLRVLPSGTPVPNPAELLGSRHLRDVVNQLCQLADTVIIDCPPTVVTDGVLLARLADGCVIVTSLNRSSKTALKASVERMRNARVKLLGIAINRSGPERRSSYSYYRPQAAELAKAKAKSKPAKKPVDVG